MTERRALWFTLVLVLVPVLVLAGCAAPRRDVPRTPSTTWAQPLHTVLGQALARQLAPLASPSGFAIIESGLQALQLRAELADAAQHCLDLQYYSLHDDATTSLLLLRVLDAAKRGVQVRILLDDADAAGRDIDLARLAAHPNIELRVFNPFANRGADLLRLFEFLGNIERLNRRMHNKLWIADNAAAIVGGRNLGDAYFEADLTRDFSDIDLFAAGPVVRELSMGFDTFWTSDDAVPIEAFLAADLGAEQAAHFEQALRARVAGLAEGAYALALAEAQRGPRLLHGGVALHAASATALQDTPSKAQPLPALGAKPASVGQAAPAQTQAPTPTPATIQPDSLLAARLRPLMEGVQHEVLLITPYFIPSERGVALLGGLAQRGVRVRVLTNSLASTDMPAAHVGYASARPRLLAGGVGLHEMRPDGNARPRRLWRPGSASDASLHAKVILIDRRHLVIGSMNLDPRSRLHNTEVAVLLDSAELGQQMAALFEESVLPTRAFQVLLDGANPPLDGAAPGQADVPEPGLRQGPALHWLAADPGQPVQRLINEPAGFWRRVFAAMVAAVLPQHWL